METSEIPPAQWPAFLDRFSRVHQGQTAHVHTPAPEALNRRDEPNLPLVGVIADPSEGSDRIRITLGTAPAGLVSYAIPDASRLRVAEWNDGYSAELDIESARGDCTVVHVGPQEQLLPPGMITDGIVM